MVIRSFATLDDLTVYFQQKVDEAAGEMNRAQGVRDAYLDALAGLQETAELQKEVPHG